MTMWQSLSIDRESPVPIYHQLSRELKKLIQSGELAPNERIPSQNEFSKWFDISPMTVRQAMMEIENEGFIYRVRGRGTFVAPRYLEHTLERLVSFSEDMRARQLSPGSRILVFEQIKAPAEIAHRLVLDEDASVLRVMRLRFANEEPVGLHDAYLRGVEITRGELEREESLYQLLSEKGVVLTEGDDIIEAIEADEEIGDLLNVKPGSALLQLTRCSRDSNGRTVEYIKAVYRSDFYRYAIRLKR